MGQASKIQWTDNTFNPWWGCEKVSPGCAHCYAEKGSQRFGSFWGKGSERRFFGDKHWNEPRRWNLRAERSGVPEKVFCASYADVCEDRPDLIEPRKRLAGLIEETPHLTWQLLTKRPENFGLMGWDVFPPNVWAMTTAEDQERADLRIPELLKVKASVRGVSYEPALGLIRFPAVPGLNKAGQVGRDICDRLWIIVGGESGPGARPFNLQWARSTVRQCDIAGVAVFVKQMGARPFDSSQVAGQFTSFTEWVNKARSWLGGINESMGRYKPAERVVCTDALDRICTNGGDFMRARDEGTFPVRWHDVINYGDPKGGDADQWPIDLQRQEFPS